MIILPEASVVAVVNPFKDDTHFAFLKILIPDLEDRLRELRVSNPAWFEELARREDEDRGFRPLACLQGFD